MPVDIDARLRELEQQLDRLKVLYEQYFVGVEKQPPTVPRREAEKALAFLSAQNIGNTAVRFRYHTLLRRWKTYVERWDRILREIESGTYAPHLARARRKLEATEGVRLPTMPGVPAVARRGDGAPGEGPVPGMTEPELRALHARYAEALRAAGDAREVSYESLVGSLSRKVPALLEKSAGAQVAFSVAVKDGKVVLRASPRSPGKRDER